MSMKMRWMALLLAGLVGMGLTGQAAFAADAAKPASASGAVGKVESVDAANHTVKLTHEEIKALGWPGMTMNFKVAEMVKLDDLHPGEQVEFDLGKGADGKWQITRMTRKGSR